MLRRVIALLCLGTALSSCTTPRGSTELSKEAAAALSDTVRSVVQDYAGTFAAVSCQNYQPLLRFFDYSGAGFLDVSETAVTPYAGDAWPRVIREAVCSRDREELTVDSLLVRVHSPDLASAAWTFRATYFDTSGVVRSAKGTALQLWHRTGEGWKTPLIMSAHQATPR